MQIVFISSRMDHVAAVIIGKENKVTLAWTATYIQDKLQT